MKAIPVGVLEQFQKDQDGFIGTLDEAKQMIKLVMAENRELDKECLGWHAQVHRRRRPDCAECRRVS